MENEFKPDYDIRTVIIGRKDIDRISEILAEIDGIETCSIEVARAINEKVLEAQNLIYEWVHTGFRKQY